MVEAKELYEQPVVQCPSLDELARLSEDLRLKCSTEDLQAVESQFRSFAASLQKMSKFKQPSLPVKYPRTPGFKPTKGDNPYNAWYWCCNIKGAETGKLAGRSIGIKDNIAVAGVPMMNGSKILEGYTPEFDATVVTRILDAGGHLHGKANCEHMCFSGSSFTCDDGPVAAGKIDMAVGGDQDGSIRAPASWCGIVGLKPTYGLVPYTGAMPIEITIDHLGPMTRTVADCAILLEVLAGYDDGLDSRQIPNVVVPEYSKLLNAGLSGKKIGVLKEGFDVCTERGVTDIVRREVVRLREAGAEVEEVSVPEHLDGTVILSAIGTQGFYNCMRKGGGYLWRGFYPISLQEAVLRGWDTRPQDLSGILKTFCLMGEYMEQNYQNKFYAQAQNLRMMLTKAYDRMLGKYDVLVVPTTPCKATKLPKSDSSLKELLDTGLSMNRNTAPFDCTGHPALSINAGFSDGLPVGMQIVGRHYDETTVLQVASAYEALRDEKSQYFTK